MTTSLLDETRSQGPAAPPPALPVREDGSGGSAGVFGDTYRVGLLAFLSTVCMLFLGFTSAYMLRRASADWRPLHPPSLLWLNSAVLLLSSAAVERARRALRGFDLRGTLRFVAATGVLGLLFVVGQGLAFGQLAGQGVFLASNPHSSFFYMLTGVHALHVLGGLCWYLAVLARVRRAAYLPGGDGLGLFALYWHFLAGLWLYLLWLLFIF